MTISDIFAVRGETEFRTGEARVILRLLESGPQVLATGGGAFTNPDTRSAIGAKGISIWLKAEFDVLMKRIRRRHDRPLLKTDDPGATLRKLMEEREPVYALADFTVQSREVMHEKIVDEIVSALAGRMGAACATPGAPADGGHEPTVRCAPAIRSSSTCAGERSYDTSGRASWLCWPKNSGRNPGQVAIVTDETVMSHHPVAAEAVLPARRRCHFRDVPRRESKSFPVLARVCEG